MEYTPNISSLKQDQEELHRLTAGAREQERGVVRDQHIVGRGVEFTPGYGPARQAFSGEYTIAPEASPSGVTFSTSTGTPVPGGVPRPFDMVEINGQKVEVHVAQRMGLLTSDFRVPGADVPAASVTRQTPTNAAISAVNVSADDSDVKSLSSTSAIADAVQAADNFQAVTMRQVSPQAIEGLMTDLLTGSLSEKTTDLFQLEGATSLPEMGRIVDGYAAKVSQATGASIDQINSWFESHPEAAGKAAQELLRTGRMDGFKALAASAPTVSETFTDMAPDEAATVYQTAQEPFLRALIEAGIEPDFRADGIYIGIPGKGMMRWEDAVRNGAVKVSRR